MTSGVGGANQPTRGHAIVLSALFFVSGAALLLPVERVVVCEILGEVVELARDHFRPWVNGLSEKRGPPHSTVGRSPRLCAHHAFHGI